MQRRRTSATLNVAALGALAALAMLWPGAQPAHAVGVVSLAPGDRHSCVVLTSGDVKCWGSNEAGQLGDGGRLASGLPVDVIGLDAESTKIAAGLAHTCVISEGGSVECWGSNWLGALGTETTETCQVGILAGPCSRVPVEVVGLDVAVVSVVAGLFHACAMTVEGGVKCWGGNGVGQLGVGTMDWEPHPLPMDVLGLESGIVSLAAGGNHTCAVTVEGAVKCWGENSEGQLGDGTNEHRASPVEVDSLEGSVTAIEAGYAHSCAVAEGRVFCWGDNARGQLGDGTTTDRLSPVEVSGLQAATEVAAGSEYTCALDTEGRVKCWGDNTVGQLGIGVRDYELHTVPEDVQDIAGGVTSLAGGSLHACVILPSQEPACWGRNNYGQLGDGTLTNRPQPVSVRGLKQTEPEAAAGDANCLGSVDSIDAALVLQLEAGLVHSLTCQDIADVNEDRFINAIDATVILQFVAGLVPQLPPN